MAQAMPSAVAGWGRADGDDGDEGGDDDRGDPTDGGRSGPRRGRRRVVVGAAVLVTAGVVAAVVASRGGSDGDAAPPPGSTATAPVEVRTLTQTERVDGTLGFGETRGVAAGAAGTVTGIAAEGSTVERGGTLFSIDQRPTVLLVGDIPLYRDLGEGVDDGADVAQLERNLADLGYTDGGALAVDDHFDDATADAVSAWQTDRGVDTTGAVTRADAVFLPGSARIAEVALDLGATAQAGASVLTYTGSTRVVEAQFEPTQADLAHVGDTVTVTLPDGNEVGGTIATVAAAPPAEGSTGSEAGSGAGSGSSGEAAGAGAGATGEDEAAIDVTIALADQEPARPFTAASVDVELTGRQREDVLAVPVTALVAQVGTGYAVEVPQDDGTTEMVPVEPGMYADGFVEVSGDGLEEGTDVVVAER